MDPILIAYEKGYRAEEDGTITGIYAEKLNLGKGTNGYLLFRIRTKDGFKSIPAHRFAAYCFFGQALFDNQCVRHLDGDKKNNARENLALGSLSDNYQDMPESWRKSFSLSGAEKTRKLSEESVREIKRLLSDGYSSRKIADQYGVSKSSIQQIKEGKSYKWVI